MDEELISKAETFLVSTQNLSISEQLSVGDEIAGAFIVMLNADCERFQNAMRGIVMMPKMLYIIAHKERYTGIGVGHG